MNDCKKCKVFPKCLKENNFVNKNNLCFKPFKTKEKEKVNKNILVIIKNIIDKIKEYKEKWIKKK